MLLRLLIGLRSAHGECHPRYLCPPSPPPPLTELYNSSYSLFFLYWHWTPHLFPLVLILHRPAGFCLVPLMVSSTQLPFLLATSDVNYLFTSPLLIDRIQVHALFVLYFWWKMHALPPQKKHNIIHACSSKTAALQGWKSGRDRRSLREDQRACAQKTRTSAQTIMKKSTVPLVFQAATKTCRPGLRATTKAITHVATAPHAWSAPFRSPFSSECPGDFWSSASGWLQSNVFSRAGQQLSQQCCQSETAALTELQHVTALLGSLVTWPP